MMVRKLLPFVFLVGLFFAAPALAGSPVDSSVVFDLSPVVVSGSSFSVQATDPYTFFLVTGDPRSVELPHDCNNSNIYAYSLAATDVYTIVGAVFDTDDNGSPSTFSRSYDGCPSGSGIQSSFPASSYIFNIYRYCEAEPYAGMTASQICALVDSSAWVPSDSDFIVAAPGTTACGAWVYRNGCDLNCSTCYDAEVNEIQFIAYGAPPGSTCDTVDDWHFDRADGDDSWYASRPAVAWAMSSYATLIPGTYVSQDVYSLDAGWWDVHFKAMGPGSVQVGYAGGTAVDVAVPSSNLFDVFTATIKTPSISDTLVFSSTGGIVMVDWVCRDYAGAADVCVAPPGGDFSTPSIISDTWTLNGAEIADDGVLRFDAADSSMVDVSAASPVSGTSLVLSFDVKSDYLGCRLNYSVVNSALGEGQIMSLSPGTVWQKSTTVLTVTPGTLFFSQPVTGDCQIDIDNVCLARSEDITSSEPFTSEGPYQIRPIGLITYTPPMTCGVPVNNPQPTNYTDLWGWIVWLATELWNTVALPILCWLAWAFNELFALLVQLLNWIIANVVNAVIIPAINKLLLYVWYLYYYLTHPSELLYILLTWLFTKWPWLLTLATWIKNLLTFDVLGFLNAVWQFVLNPWDVLWSSLWYLIQPFYDVVQFFLWLLQRFYSLFLVVLAPFYWVYQFFSAIFLAFTGSYTEPELYELQFSVFFAPALTLLAFPPVTWLIRVVNVLMIFDVLRWVLNEAGYH